MPLYLKPRDWSKITISRGHDTRPAAGVRGKKPTLVLSIPLEIGQEFKNRFLGGVDFAYVTIIRDKNELLLQPTPTGGSGRKFGTIYDKRDYRVTFDSSQTPFIADFHPFGATPCEHTFNGDGLLMRLPNELRPIQPYLGFRHRQPTRGKQQPELDVNTPQRSRPIPLTNPRPAANSNQDEGVLYLVMVPYEKESQFSRVCSFMGLEILK